MILMRSNGAVAVLVTAPDPAPAIVCRTSLWAWLLSLSACGAAPFLAFASADAIEDAGRITRHWGTQRPAVPPPCSCLRPANHCKGPLSSRVGTGSRMVVRSRANRFLNESQAAMAMARAVVKRVNTGVGRLYRVTTEDGRGGLRVLPSVTSVINERANPLITWGVKLALNTLKTELAGTPGLDTPKAAAAFEKALAAPETHRDNAAKFGTAAHAAIDAIITGAGGRVADGASAVSSKAGAASDAAAAAAAAAAPAPAVDEDAAAVKRVVAAFRRWHAASKLRLSPAGDSSVYSRRYGFAGSADCLGVTPDGRTVVVLDFKTGSLNYKHAYQLGAYCQAVREMLFDGELVVPGFSHPAVGAGAAALAAANAGVAAAAAGSGAPASGDAASSAPPSSSPPAAATSVAPASSTSSSSSSLSHHHDHRPEDIPVMALLVHLDRSGSYTVKRVVDVDAALTCFKSYLLLWHLGFGKPLLQEVAKMQSAVDADQWGDTDDDDDADDEETDVLPSSTTIDGVEDAGGPLLVTDDSGSDTTGDESDLDARGGSHVDLEHGDPQLR